MEAIEITLSKEDKKLLQRVTTIHFILDELRYPGDSVRLWDREWELLKEGLKKKIEEKGTRNREKLMHLLSLLSTKI